MLEIIKKGILKLRGSKTGYLRPLQFSYILFNTCCYSHFGISLCIYSGMVYKYRFHGGPCKIFPLEGKFLAYEVQTIASYEFCFVVLLLRYHNHYKI